MPDGHHDPTHPRDAPDSLRCETPGARREAPAPAEEPGRGRVVVGIDGSAESRAALHWAVRHARDVGAGVQAVAVWHRPVQFADGVPLPAEDFAAQARGWLADALAELGPDETGPAGVETTLEEGDPAQRLLEHARGAEVLVLGNRGRGPLAGALAGSVALRCAHHASCPVALVPSPEGPEP